MVFDSLQAEFMGTKNNTYIHMYDTAIVGIIIVHITNAITNDN